MKTANESIVSKLRITRFGPRLAVIAGIGMLALGTASFAKPNCAAPPAAAAENTQTAELLQLAADFHGALSYHGDITAMMSLWADNCSLTFNGGTPYVGKTAVSSFFTSGGYFLNNWVSLAPEYKTVITIHGNKAEISTQCVAIDLNTLVVKSVIQVNATCEKVKGQWLFTSMNNASGATL